MCLFTYKGNKGVKIDVCGVPVWNITFRDGSHDTATSLKFALILCDNKVKRANP